MTITTREVADFLEIPVFLVGGAVRDTLLGKQVKDYDFTTPIDPETVEQAIVKKERHPFVIGKRFGTIGYRHQAGDHFEHVEITTFRAEKYQTGSRKPVVEFVQDLQEDLQRRDFTINAMAIDAGGNLIDYFNGQEDLKNGIVRAVGNAKSRFKEDPLRMLRAVRFATTLGFKIEEKTLQAIQKEYYRLLLVSKERWVQEMDKVLASDNVFEGLELLRTTRLMNIILPELTTQFDYDQNSPYHDFDLWTHTKRVVAAVPSSKLDLRWAALLHDVAKPYTRTENPKGHSNYIAHDLLGADLADMIARRLKFSNKRREFMCEIIKTHLHPDCELKQYDDYGKK